MNFDYQQTRAEVTFQLVGIGDWAFKKVAALGSSELNAGPENAHFNKHRTEMGNAGWALVSMTAIAGTLTQTSHRIPNVHRRQNISCFGSASRSKRFPRRPEAGLFK